VLLAEPASNCPAALFAAYLSSLLNGLIDALEDNTVLPQRSKKEILLLQPSVQGNLKRHAYSLLNQRKM
jgi:hypothetical protein